jgi:hypothetical protein
MIERLVILFVGLLIVPLTLSECSSLEFQDDWFDATANPMDRRELYFLNTSLNVGAVTIPAGTMVFGVETGGMVCVTAVSKNEDDEFRPRIIQTDVSGDLLDLFPRPYKYDPSVQAEQ